MKGIAHFAAGVAAASCFPDAVRAGASGNGWYFLLGGVFGLLPDTVDFKGVRFFYRHDIEVQPDPSRFDPAMVAGAVAMALQRALDTGRPVRIKLNTVRLGADRWQRYEVAFDVARSRVSVTVGPVVDTGGNVVKPAPAGDGTTASAPVLGRLRLDYLAVTPVDIFDGPVFEMRPDGAGGVTPAFIPWHRVWTHSLVSAVAVAGLVGLAGGWLAAGVALAALGAHILFDQIGHMGSSLMHPFVTKRIPGLRWTHSGDPFPNFAVVWASCALVFWNLARASDPRVWSVSPIRYGVWAVLLPLAGAWTVLRRRGGPQEPDDEEDEAGLSV